MPKLVFDNSLIILIAVCAVFLVFRGIIITFMLNVLARENYQYRRNIYVDLCGLMFLLLLYPKSFIMVAQTWNMPELIAISYMSTLLITGLYVLVNVRREFLRTKS